MTNIFNSISHMYIKRNRVVNYEITYKVASPFYQVRSSDKLKKDSTGPMATNIDRTIAFDEQPTTTKSIESLIKWSPEFIWQIKNVISSSQLSLWPPNLTKHWVLLRSSSTESRNLLKTWGYVTNKKWYSSTATRFMTTKRDKGLA